MSGEDRHKSQEDMRKTDFLNAPVAAIIAWGIPIGAMFAAIGVAHPVKTWVWVVALAWMGTACLWNARRCQRKHCFATGPFFLIMIIPVLLYGYGVADLGAGGWRWLGLAVGVGAFGLMSLTERTGRYR